MKRIQAIHPTLASGQQGTDIANLHVVLDKLEFGGPVTERERANHRFGQGTAEAVRRLQSQFAIPARQPGVVDEQAAQVINQRLFEMGVFRLVRGRVTNRDGSAIAGNLLFAFDQENIGVAYLGSDSTNADGAYQIFYDPSLYARSGAGVLQVKKIIDLVVQRCGRSKRRDSLCKTVLGYSDSDPRDFRTGGRPIMMWCGMHIERII